MRTTTTARIETGTTGNGLVVTVFDALSRTLIAEFTLTNEEVGRFVTAKHPGMDDTIEVEYGSNERYGQVRQNITIAIPELGNVGGAEDWPMHYAKACEPYEGDGWIASLNAPRNMHRRQDDGSYLVTFYRWAAPGTPADYEMGDRPGEITKRYAGPEAL